MPIAIEISDSDIRLVRSEGGKLLAMEAYPLPADGDPIAALAAAPLPHPLGPVRVTLDHGDMLLRPMMQPPAPEDRLARIIRFELKSFTEGEQENLLSWYIPAIGGTGDMRVLVQLCKKQLVTRIQEALAAHGGKLSALIDPSVALFHLSQQLPQSADGGTVLVDCGRQQVRIVYLSAGELLFYRSHRPGMDELVQGVAELRGVDAENAERLLRKLGRNPPEDLRDLIKRHGMAIAAAVTNNQRFAKTQLKINDYKIDRCLVTGRAARLPGLIETLGQRLQVPVQILNPFSGQLPGGMPSERLDSFAQLPSTWGAAIGLAATASPRLDVLEQLRTERRDFWSTTGALRAGVVAAAAIMVLAVLMQMVRMGIQNSAIATLEGEGGAGMVPQAEAAEAELGRAIDDKHRIATRLRWLDNERMAGRVAVELLNVIAGIQDPKDMPVYIQNFRLTRPSDQPGSIRIELKGFAEPGSGQRKPHEVIGEFKAALQQAYAPVAGIRDEKSAAGGSSQNFHWILTVAARAAI